MKRTKLILLLIVFWGTYLRFINITSPLTDWHSWRQTFTAMISRNFFENGYRILEPQIDYAGRSPGYVPLEFPLYQFIVSLFYKFFGVKEWLGKFISIIFSIGTMFFLFFLTKIYYNEKTALYATSVFAFLPLSIFYSQTFMPESLLIFCSAGSIYFLSKWIEDSKTINFLISLLLTTTAFLVKLTSIYLLFPLLYLFWFKYSKESIKKYEFWIFIIFAILPSFLWYIIWIPKLSFERTFGSIWDTKDRWGNLNWWLNIEWYQKIFLQHISENWLLFIGLVFFILGFSQKIKDKKEYVFHIWTFGIILYFFVVAQGNWMHEYYQFPIVLPASIFIGKSLNNIFEGENKKIKLAIILILLLLIPVGRYKLLRRFKRNDSYYYAGLTINKITPADSLILVSDYDKPEVLYYSHRKGWHITPDVQNKEIVESYINQGAEYFVTTCMKEFYSNKDFYEYIRKNYRLIKEDKSNFIIFRLTREKSNAR
ncbi:MAG: ArnT family glycosyltransferase [Endomicrobiia bacterium]